MRRLLIPISWIYRLGLWCHRFSFEKIKGRHRFLIPVVSVGNLTWGGTGKTPLTIYLAEAIQQKKKTSAVLMRGYGRDESRLFKRREIKVARGADRIQLGTELLENIFYDLFLLDDGFQHWPLERDLDIVCINALDPFGNGCLIPAGSLREPKGALKRAHIVVITHADQVERSVLEKLERNLTKINPFLKIAWARHEPVELTNAYGESEKKSSLDQMDKKAQKPYFLVSGLGSPESFRHTATHFLGRPPSQEFHFRDHHLFRREELVRIATEAKERRAVCLISEKDWVRIPEFFEEFDVFKVLKIQLSFLKGEDLVLKSLDELLKPKTLRALVLSDEKKGHVNQSLALLNLMRQALQKKSVKRTVEETRVAVRYKNEFLRFLLWLKAPFLSLWVRQDSSLSFLKFFLTRDSWDSLRKLQADVILSAGASVLPVHKILKRKLKTKSIVLMRPRFPYGPGNWNLVIQPSHDGGNTRRNVVTTQAALSTISEETLRSIQQEADRRFSLKGEKGISIFVGGNAKDYVFSEEKITRALDQIRQYAREEKIPFFLTTSRRTPQPVIEKIKEMCQGDTLCKYLVIPSEQDEPNAVERMLSVSRLAIVTEESISMISEALRSGSRVVGLSVNGNGLKKKKQRFKSGWESNGGLIFSGPEKIRQTIKQALLRHKTQSFLKEEEWRIQERLVELL